MALFILFVFYAIAVLIAGFVVFVLVLMSGTATIWGAWTAIQTIRGKPINVMRDLLILQTALLLLVLASPFLYVGILALWASL